MIEDLIYVRSFFVRPKLINAYRKYELNFFIELEYSKNKITIN